MVKQMSFDREERISNATYASLFVTNLLKCRKNSPEMGKEQILLKLLLGGH